MTKLRDGLNAVYAKLDKDEKIKLASIINEIENRRGNVYGPIRALPRGGPLSVKAPKPAEIPYPPNAGHYFLRDKNRNIIGTVAVIKLKGGLYAKGVALVHPGECNLKIKEDYSRVLKQQIEKLAVTSFGADHRIADKVAKRTLVHNIQSLKKPETPDKQKGVETAVARALEAKGILRILMPKALKLNGNPANQNVVNIQIGSFKSNRKLSAYQLCSKHHLTEADRAFIKRMVGKPC